MNLSNIRAPKKATEKRKRVGRGMAPAWARLQPVDTKGSVRVLARA